MRKWRELTRDEKFVTVTTAAVVVGTCGYMLFDTHKSLNTLHHIKSCRKNLETASALVESKDATDRLMAMYHWGHGVDDVAALSTTVDTELYNKISNAYAHVAEDILSNPIDVK